MTEPLNPSPHERVAATRLCARLGMQPTDLTPRGWLNTAIAAESDRDEFTHRPDEYLFMGALAERFPGRNFR